MFGKRNTVHYSNLKIEIEIGGFCSFNNFSPSNGMHFHNCYEICYVISGEGYYRCSDEDIKLNKGTVFIADPNVLHEIKLDGTKPNSELKLIYLLFKPHQLSKLSTSNIIEYIYNAFLEDHNTYGFSNSNIDTCVDLIRNYSILNQLDEEILLNIYPMLLLELIRSLVKPSKQFYAFTEQNKSLIDIAMTYIRENIDKKLSVADISEITGTSVRNLEYIFKKHANCTVLQYIHARKINLACSYLRMNYSISSVSKMIGIDDASQFSRLFKKMKHISPKEYRRLYSSAGVNFAAFADNE